MTIIVRNAIVLVTSCFFSATAWCADNSAKIRAIVDAAVRPLMAEHGVPGMAVAVTVDGKAHIFNYGLASKEKKTPVDDATLFELGSVSKPITATLASWAQVQGKLSMDDHPSKYMPQLKGSAIDKASLLHLGTYTAGGLPLQFPDAVADGQMVSYFQQWKPVAAPGTQRDYSNPSLGLFGHLAALALKGDFTDLMEKQLFPQLGMNSSHLHVPENRLGNYAWGYDQADKPARVKRDIFSEQAYGGTATATDMIRFVQLNIDPSALPGPMRRAIEGTQVGYFAVGGMVQGLGWEQYPYPLTLEQLVEGNSSGMSQKPNAARNVVPSQVPPHAILFNKSGSTRGFGNYVAFVPQMKIGVVILANKQSPAQARVKAAHAILGQLAPQAN